jgi:hypothetical protein
MESSSCSVNLFTVMVLALKYNYSHTLYATLVRNFRLE